ncbi:hypothetical protein CH267_06675 [Rhodococcus sp. 06-621-2]|nr:DUF2637 domain-containing protein [Rhodococcus sp. 06-621-2]OZC59770.1 hypothetical protein CH267_06675 [Rhodococcus sp. 06-621-2]
MTNANTRTKQETTEDTREIHPSVITWALVTGLVVAFVVTAASFKLSFATLLDLASMAGLRDSAWVIPVVLDGPILAAGVFRIALSQHTDRATVRGRRFIIAVFALAGLASMAGNAYHAVLTVTDLDAAVAAAIGALAPLMVMTMCDMMAIAISAPRRRVVKTPIAAIESVEMEVAYNTGPQHEESHETGSTTKTLVVDEDVDNGLLKPAVWASVHLWLENPEWSNSDIAGALGIHTSTVGRHLRAWNEVQRSIAHNRSIKHGGVDLQNDNGRHEDAIDGGFLANYQHSDDDHTTSAADMDTVNYDYAGTAR